MAFRATLEEVLAADIIVHVRDVANPDSTAQKQDVIAVLQSLGLKDIENQPHYLEVLNKIDLLDKNSKAEMAAAARKRKNAAVVSAVSGEGLPAFLEQLDKTLSYHHCLAEVTVSAADGALMAWLHENSEILSSQLQNEQYTFRVRIAESELQRLAAKTAVKTLD